MDASNMDVTIDHIAKDGGKLKAYASGWQSQNKA